MERTYIVYCAQSPSGKVYVGCTSTGLAERQRLHKLAAARFPHYKFYRAIKRYGFESFTWRVVEECPTHESMLEAEIRLIAELDSVRSGYNITTGGQGAAGRRNTPEQSAQHSERQRRRFECEAERRRAAKKVREWLEANPEQHAVYAERRAATLQTTEFRARAKATRLAYLAANPESIAETSKRSRAIYQERPEICSRISRTLGGKPFVAIKDGQIRHFETVEGCSRELGILAGNITHCLKGRRKSAGGFAFRYTDECEDLPSAVGAKPTEAMA